MEGSKKVLIAEDSSVIQNLTKKILEIQNYEIYSAKNGAQVIDMLEKDDKKSKIPIVAITGNARNYSMDDFKDVGINEYLQKPLDFDKLVNLVKSLTA